MDPQEPQKHSGLPSDPRIRGPLKRREAEARSLLVEADRNLVLARDCSYSCLQEVCRGDLSKGGMLPIAWGLREVETPP